MKIGVPQETFPGERRVALIPASVDALKKLKCEVCIQAGAGTSAGFLDSEYAERGAQVVETREEVYQSADAIFQVRSYGSNPDQGQADLSLLKSGQVLLGFQEPLTALEEMKALADAGVIALAVETVPRITRAQSMDCLSSMATVAGYQAVLMAASKLPRMFPMLMTAAGTVAPARVFVVGAGVAGLQAIATARRLGAVVTAYDVRSAVKEQILSLGAKFLEIEVEGGEAEDKGGYAKDLGEEFYRKQREMMTELLAETDVVITTAAVPGKKAPVLVTRDMVTKMPTGSVVIDLAAERGGNCECTVAGEETLVEGVNVVGPVNVPSTIPYHASQMYAKNLTTLLAEIVDEEGNLTLNLEDEVVAGTLITNNNEIVHPTVKELAGKTGPEPVSGS